MTEGISENNNVSLESPVVRILWIPSFNPILELPHFQKLQTTLNFSGISISRLCAMDEELQGLSYNFPSKTQGSNCKGGLRAVQITGFQFSCQTKQLKKNVCSNWTEFTIFPGFHTKTTTIPTQPTVLHLTWNVPYVSRGNIFGKCKHLANADIKGKEMQDNMYKIVAEGLFSLNFYIQFTPLLYWEGFFPTVLTITGFAPVSKVSTFNIRLESHSYSTAHWLSTIIEVVCMKWLIGTVPFWNDLKSNC